MTGYGGSLTTEAGKRMGKVAERIQKAHWLEDVENGYKVFGSGSRNTFWIIKLKA